MGVALRLLSVSTRAHPGSWTGVQFYALFEHVLNKPVSSFVVSSGTLVPTPAELVLSVCVAFNLKHPV